MTDLARGTYRDATFSQETRERLLMIEQVLVAAMDTDLLPQYLEMDYELSLHALRGIMDRWDSNDATEIVL